MNSPFALECSWSFSNTFCQTEEEERQNNAIIYTHCIFHIEVSQAATVYFIPLRGRNVSQRELLEMEGMNK